MINRSIYVKRKIPFPFIDIFLFNWNNLGPTDIHNHAKNGCYIILLKGKLKENIYNKSLKKINSYKYKSPSISYIDDKIGFHSIEPLEESLSIHFYHPKKHKTKYYKINK